MRLPLKVLFDAGPRIHSQFLDGAEIHQKIEWGDITYNIPVVGYARKPRKSSPDQQKEIDALFTVGQLIRDGKIEAFTSTEIQTELMRGRIIDPTLNAFRDCEFQSCPPPVHRSKFRSTIDLLEWTSKGGKKDRNRFKSQGGFTQIACLRWFLDLNTEHIDALINHSDDLKLTKFEIESLHELPWFQTLAKKIRSEENLPDAFHVWTAKRNQLDVFCSLDKRLSNSIEGIKKEKKTPMIIEPLILRPTQLLRLLNIKNKEKFPLAHDKFYYVHQVLRCQEVAKKRDEMRWLQRFLWSLFRFK